MALDVGGVLIETYWEHPFHCDPMSRPGYWNQCLELQRIWFENLELGRDQSSWWGPHCPIHYCDRRYVNGLIVPPHPGWWLLQYTASGRCACYCNDHLPVRYLSAICGPRWQSSDDCRTELHRLFPPKAVALAI